MKKKPVKEDKTKRRARTRKASAAQVAMRDRRTKAREKAKRDLLMERVLELRDDGATFARIGKKLEISKGHACELFHERLAQVREPNNEIVKRERRHIGHDLRVMMEKLYGLGMNPRVTVVAEKVNSKGETVTIELEEFEKVVKTTASYAKLAERQAKLWGLDSPAKVDLTGTGAFNAMELARRVRRER